MKEKHTEPHKMIVEEVITYVPTNRQLKKKIFENFRNAKEYIKKISLGLLRM